MKFKIYFNGGDFMPIDNVTIEGETIEEVKENGEAWLKSRGLTIDNVEYTEEVK